MAIVSNVEVDRDLKDDAILRRYLDVSRFLNLLNSKALYLCRGDLFQDKFEGSFTPSLKRNFEETRSQRNSKISYEEFRKALREGVFVSCWSLGADDNMALWRLYGGVSNSVAITTTVKRLREAMQAFQTPGRHFLRRVKYIKHWRDPALGVVRGSSLFGYKVVGYEFEREVRLILDSIGHTTQSEGVSLPVDLNTFIRSIVIAPESAPWFKHAIEDVTKRYDVTVHVKTSKLAMAPI